MTLLPRSIWALLTIYFLATLAHFAHNAEFIAFYPNMPQSLTRETVYLAWLAVTAIGVAALIATRFLPVLGAVLLGGYGAMVLVTTRSLSRRVHLATNFTIWSEVTRAGPVGECIRSHAVSADITLAANLRVLPPDALTASNPVPPASEGVPATSS
jgi:hypothetical protein